ncbi:pyrimidine dimer DNA glycosylase/endonuclease V [Methylococcus sp. ANG]|uniref:pyrimidine dimer DNA glycosylase/endonuclease V n=1 Tax=unclassified Methylococcus TaxID=2618889 RepID=UPI002106D518|nr:pyrimidine dimer DNA glycosylase/endonuclease V [Methylococcus sp. Mc7]
MRLWTLHPRYLDAKGLVALWREALLAQAVLKGLTRGYTRHPQLTRFRETPAPEAAITHYLRAVHAEGERRGYRFDAGKIAPCPMPTLMTATDGQLAYEWAHLTPTRTADDEADILPDIILLLL